MNIEHHWLYSGTLFEIFELKLELSVLLVLFLIYDDICGSSGQVIPKEPLPRT